jgi:hypothetical protein
MLLLAGAMAARCWPGRQRRADGRNDDAALAGRRHALQLSPAAAGQPTGGGAMYRDRIAFYISVKDRIAFYISVKDRIAFYISVKDRITFYFSI